MAVIEDCAHAIGASIEDKYVGKFSDFAIFSFQAVKHITTIDGGFLLYKNSKLHEKLKRLRWFGLLKGEDRTKPSITDIGFKYNMSNISAALGIYQLKRLDSIISANRNCAMFYNENLNNLDFLKVVNKKDISPTYWLYTLLSKNSDKFIQFLNEHGIAASKVHIPNNFHPLFNDESLLNTKIFYNQLVHLPCGNWVSKADQEYILDTINKYVSII